VQQADGSVCGAKLGVNFLVFGDGFVRTVQHTWGFGTAVVTGYDAVCWFAMKDAGLWPTAFRWIY